VAARATNEMAMQKSRGLKNLTPEFVAGLMCIAVVLRQMKEERGSQNLLGFASSETQGVASMMIAGEDLDNERQ
jgi:hypothetical protein